LALVAAWAVLALAAVAGEPAAPAPAEGAPQEEQTLYDYMFRGAGGVIEIVILLCSAAGLALTADYIYSIRVSRSLPPTVVKLIRRDARRKELYEIVAVCEENPCFFTRVLRAGLLHMRYGLDAVKNSVADATEKEASSLHDRIGYIAFLSSVTPMLGLLGTVVGMIGAFSKIGEAEASARFSELAGDIAIALITTATGLLVAIPAMFVFFFFRNRINRIVVECDTLVMGVMEQLLRQKPRRGRSEE
jgi:biopolymer transport protein ExbB